MPDLRREAGVSAGGSGPLPRAVILVGFMGAGKTSVGARLSRKLGWRFVDLDERIEARTGRSIPEIFRLWGEQGFRRVEHEALRELLAEVECAAPLIAALGGGAFVEASNQALLEAPAIATVYLDAPVEELWRRSSQEGVERPLRGDEAAFRRLHEERRAHYLRARRRIQTEGKNVDVIVNEVLEALGLRQGEVK